MTSQFFKSYVDNLKELFEKTTLNHKSIEKVNKRIEELTADAQEKFKALFIDTMKKRRQPQDDDDKAIRNSQIKRIYYTIKQIHKLEDEKCSLTRDACGILDNHLDSLNEQVKSTTLDLLNAEDRDDESIERLSDIAHILKKPVHGNAVIVDMIKKMESNNDDKKSNTMAVDYVNKMAEAENFKGFSFQADVAKETVAEVHNLTNRMNDLEYFTDKVIGICSAMRDKYDGEEIFNFDSDIPANNDEEVVEEEASSTDLCHCRTPEFGEMVFCDGADCKIRWYHFECVGIHSTPVGLWFCPSCVIFTNADVSTSTGK